MKRGTLRALKKIMDVMTRISSLGWLEGGDPRKGAMRGIAAGHGSYWIRMALIATVILDTCILYEQITL